MPTPIVSDDASNSFFESYFLYMQSTKTPQTNPQPTKGTSKLKEFHEHLDSTVNHLKAGIKKTQNRAIKESVHQQLKKLQDIQEKLQNDPAALNALPIHNTLQEINSELQEIAQVALVTQESSGIKDLYEAIDEMAVCIAAVKI